MDAASSQHLPVISSTYFFLIIIVFGAASFAFQATRLVGKSQTVKSSLPRVFSLNSKLQVVKMCNLSMTQVSPCDLSQQVCY